MAVQSLCRVFRSDATVRIVFKHPGDLTVHFNDNVLSQQAGIAALARNDLFNRPDGLPFIQCNFVRCSGPPEPLSLSGFR